MKRNRVVLNGAQRLFLEEQISGGKLKGTKLRRAQILLGVDEAEQGKGLTTDQVVTSYGCSRATVHNVRSRFVKQGFDLALNGKPRPVNRKSKIDGRGQSQIIALRCSDPPDGESRWTLRLMCDKVIELGIVDDITPQGMDYILKKLPSNPGE
jgi:transposase